VYMLNIEELCAPALIYLIFATTHVLLDTTQQMYYSALVKLIISILITILLNQLCMRGLGIVSWIIIFVPFILLSTITVILLWLFGIDEKGRINIRQEVVDQRGTQFNPAFH
jgi:hypothetical protein